MEYPTIFIVTHGRPDKQLTLGVLKKHNYLGKIFLVLDNTDKTIQQYIDNYGKENIFVFNKNHYINTVELVSNKPKFACSLYARCACEDIAKKLNVRSFMIVDDDVLNFRIRFPENDKLISYKDFDLSEVFVGISEYMRNANIAAIGCAYENMAMSGVKMFSTDSLLKNRLLYNSVFRNGDLQFSWKADIFEDVISSVLGNISGNVFLCLPFLQCTTEPTHVIQFEPKTPIKLDGGSSEAYAEDGLKLIFRGVICAPTHISLRAVVTKGVKNYQCIKRKNFPKIISDKYRRTV